MIGPVVDWPAIIASVEDNIRKEETTLLELTEKKCDPVRIAQSNARLKMHRQRLDIYKQVIDTNNDTNCFP